MATRINVALYNVTPILYTSAQNCRVPRGATYNQDSTVVQKYEHHDTSIYFEVGVNRHGNGDDLGVLRFRVRKKHQLNEPLGSKK